jgi:hypothetical protein
MSADRNGFGSFGVSVRKFCVRANEPAVGRIWSSGSFLDAPKGIKPKTRIFGKAFLDRDTVCVIGTGERSNEFELIVDTDEDVEDSWQKTREISSFGIKAKEITPQILLMQRIIRRLNEKPPTATLYKGFKDLELGFEEDRWQLCCAIPADVMAQLADDIIGRKVVEINFTLNWVGALVQNKQAPPVPRTVWGLFELPGGLGPVPLRGYIECIQWKLSSVADNFVTKRILS